MDKTRFMRPKVSVVVPVWNAKDLTEKTLRSLAAQHPYLTDPLTEIIIIDNGSKADTAEFLDSIDWLPAKILRNPTNRGFPVACNQGAAMARGEVLVFLNSDVESEGPWIKTLYHRLTWEDGARRNLNKNIGSAGPEVVSWNAGPKFLGRNTPYVNGWCLGVRKELFDWLGGFDEIYSPGYSEDRDFGYRVHIAGLAQAQVPMPLRHLGNGSSRDPQFDRNGALDHGVRAFEAKWAVEEPKRIAFIRCWAIGDMVMASAAIGGARRRWPNAHIAWVVSANMLPYVQGCPYVDELLIAEAGAEEALTGQEWDLVVQLQDLRPNEQLPDNERAENKYPDGELPQYKAAKAKRKKLWWKEQLERPMGTKDQTNRTINWHVVESFCHTIGEGCRPWFSFAAVDPEMREEARQWLAKHEPPYILVHPSGGWKSKRWPAEKAQSVMNRLAYRRLATVIAVGTYEQYDLPDGVVDMRRRTSPAELCALLEQVHVVVTGDNGIGHVANALNTPVVNVWGPTRPWNYYPAGRGPTWDIVGPAACSPCNRPWCRVINRGGSRMPCVSDLDEEQVIDTVRDAMQHGITHPHEWRVPTDRIPMEWRG